VDRTLAYEVAKCVQPGQIHPEPDAPGPGPRTVHDCSAADLGEQGPDLVRDAGGEVPHTTTVREDREVGRSSLASQNIGAMFPPVTLTIVHEIVSPLQGHRPRRQDPKIRKIVMTAHASDEDV
jgi:hypothetical protein